MSSTVTSATFLDGLRDTANEAVWRRFRHRYEPMLLAFVRRAGFREQDAHDVVQETLVAFLEGFRAGKYDPDKGRLQGWLRGIAHNKVRECWRRLARLEVQAPEGTDSTGLLARLPDDRTLTDVFDREWENAVLAECLRRVQEEVDAQTFAAFDLYARQGWPPDRVAEHLGIPRNVVYISKSRVLSRLRRLQGEIVEIW